MKIRLQPWFTDACSTFLNNLFKWYPNYTEGNITVLEWGGGNSTFYFLQKKCKLLTIESDDHYINSLVDLARGLGFKVATTDSLIKAAELLPQFDLTILKASSFEEVGGEIFNIQDWSFIVNDGISRKDVLDYIYNKENCNSIIVLDNVEYSANWGKLERCSAHPERVKCYRDMLTDIKWRHYLFEQSEGREGHSSPDATGWEAPHRWISGVLWQHNHLLSQLMISHLGFPLITKEGINNDDIKTLAERCPFDWDNTKWLVEEYNDVFKLPRNFD